MIGRAYLDCNYPIVHRRSQSPRRELPRDPVPVPTSDLRAEACRLQLAAAILSSEPDLNEIADFHADFHAHAHALPARRACSDRATTHWHNGQQPRSELAATALQTHRMQDKRAENALQQAQHIHVNICMYLG